MPSLALTTERLELIAGTLEMFSLSVSDHAALGALLEARIPAGWPPEHYDQHMLDFSAYYLSSKPDNFGWLHWYIVLHEPHSSARVAIGVCGFKGKPATNGSVEIGYSIVEAYQRAGYTTEAVRALLAWAFGHDEVQQVVGETYPRLVASVRVLQKNGFHQVTGGIATGVVRYVVTRDDFLDN